jgi:subtilisin family serine protease
MKKRVGILLASFALIFTAQGQKADWTLPHEPGRLLLVRADGINEQQIQTWHAFQGLGILKKLRGDRPIHLAELLPGQDAQTIAVRFEESGLFRIVEPDYLIESSVLEPNDPAYVDGELWGLENIGQRNGTADSDIDASDAWDTITSAEDIVVGVIDTGIRYTHVDLRDNMWINPGEIAGNGVDDDRNGVIDDVYGFNGIDGSGDPMDDNGHGTHVSGTIGAVGNNGIGTVGVAWNVKIMGLKFLRASGSGATSDAIKCIGYAREQGVDVINASWGGTGYSSALESAIASLEEVGIIFVAAAGNDNVNIDLFGGQSAQYPAALPNPNIITVASTTRNDARSSFSNVGRTSVDLAAPGSRIYSTWFDSDASYHTIDGTSMAAPHVVGAVALLRALRPNAPYQQIISTLYATVDPIPQLADNTVTGGRLNIGAAVAALSSSQPPPELTDLTISVGALSPSFNSLTFNYAVAASFETTSMTVTPTAPEGTAIIVDEALVVSGQPSQPRDLSVGRNEILIQLFDGSSSRYSVVVTRASEQSSYYTVIQDPVGNATGILNLEVDGVLYDVELKRDFGADLFTLPLIFNSEQEALAAVQAVSDALNAFSEVTTVNQQMNIFYDVPFDFSGSFGWSVRSAEYFTGAGGWQPFSGSSVVPNLSASSFAIFTEVEPSLAILSLTGITVPTGLKFTLYGDPGETYIVESSMNLASNDWQTVTPVTLDDSGTFETDFLTDPAIGEIFYRATLPVAP